MKKNYIISSRLQMDGNGARERKRERENRERERERNDDGPWIFKESKSKIQTDLGIFGGRT